MRVRWQKIRKFMALLVFLVLLGSICGAYMFPMWTGEVLSYMGGYSKVGWYNEIPQSYKIADDWLSEQDEQLNRLVSFPTFPADTVAYNWGSGYMGIHPISLFSKSALDSNINIPTIDNFKNSLPVELLNTNQFWKIMGLLNAKHIVVHRDWNYEFMKADPLEYYFNNLSSVMLPDPALSSKITGGKAPSFDESQEINYFDETESGWSNYGVGSHMISIDKTVFKEGTGSVLVSSEVEKANWEGGVKFNTDGSWDWSTYDYISFWIKFSSLDRVHRVYFDIYDTDGNHRRWGITDKVGEGWTRVSLPLQGGYLYDSPNILSSLSAIDYITIGLESKIDTDAFADWWLNDMRVVPGKLVAVDETESGWSNYGVGSHMISIDKTVFKEGTGSVLVSSEVEKANWEGGVKFNTDGSWDWSTYDYISFWIKFSSLDRVHRVYFDIYDTDGNHRRWGITDKVGEGWTRVSLPLQGGYLYDSPNILSSLSAIDYITIGLESKIDTDAFADWWLNDMRVVPGKIVAQEHIRQVRDFGELVFYEVDDEYFIPRVYATNQFVVVEDLQKMFPMLGSIDPRDQILFLQSQSSTDDISFLSGLKTDNLHKPSTSFEQINDTKYIVHIKNAAQPFFLILLSTYDERWEMHISGEKVPDGNHFIVNGYANAWYIDKPGEYNITLEFMPQSLFYLGVVVSIFTFIGFAIYLGRNWLRGWILNRWKKRI